MKIKYIAVITFIILGIIVYPKIINNSEEEIVDSTTNNESVYSSRIIKEANNLNNEVIEDSNYTGDYDKDSIEEYELDRNEVEAIARTLYGECRGIPSDMEKAAVVWCILNRVDAGFGDSIIEVITAPYQFVGYSPDHPLLDELISIAEDVMIRWYREKEGESNIGRVLPPEYLWFSGDGSHNWFVSEYGSTNYWNWDCVDVYVSIDTEISKE